MRVTPELVVIALGLVLLAVGLIFCLGWELAAVVVGAVLVVLGSWSASQAGRGGE